HPWVDITIVVVKDRLCREAVFQYLFNISQQMPRWFLTELFVCRQANIPNIQVWDTVHNLQQTSAASGGFVYPSVTDVTERPNHLFPGWGGSTTVPQDQPEE
ncbi:MAG: hypothetical protein ACTSWQ_09370, partial [Candidatus Thorarchaeota archaeon]